MHHCLKSNFYLLGLLDRIGKDLNLFSFSSKTILTEFSFLSIKFKAHLAQPNVIDGWQHWRDKTKDKVEPAAGFEKSLPQIERVNTGEDDGDTEYDQESCQEVELCSRNCEAFNSMATNLKPLHGFFQDKIEDEVFQKIKRKEEGGNTGFDCPQRADQK